MKNNIKTARENRGLTQQECVEIFDVKLRAWQTYEQGVSEPKYELLCKIADTFGVTTDYLLGREEQKNPLANLNVTVDDDKFIELYSTLPEYAKQIFVEVMSKLAEASKGQKQVITENATASELEEKAKAQAQEQDAG